MSWTGWGSLQDGNRETPTLEAVMREQQKERAPIVDVELPAAAECDGLAGERARHGGAQPKCEHLSGQGAIESSQGKKSQEEEDLALALTLQAVEEEELLLAQEQYARQLDAAKRSGTEKIRVVLPGEVSEGGGRTGGSALAYTKSVEAAEKMLEKTYKDYRS